MSSTPSAALVAALRRHPKRLALQQAACAALGNVTKLKDSAAEAAAAGAVKHVARALLRPASTAGVRQAAVWCLGNLASRSDRRAADVVDAAGTEALRRETRGGEFLTPRRLHLAMVAEDEVAEERARGLSLIHI